MPIGVEKLKPMILRKEWRYLILLLLWIPLTILLTTHAETLSYFKLRPLIQSKLFFVAIIFLGREILFRAYRDHKILKRSILFIFCLIFGIHLMELIKTLDWWRLGLTAIDTAFWSLFAGMAIETAIVYFSFWRRLKNPSWTEYSTFWRRCWSEIVFWGLWITLLESLTYYYLINFYMLDTIFYSYLFSAFLVLSGFTVFATFYSKTGYWISSEMDAIDERIQEYLWWRSTPPEEVAQFWQYFQWLLALKEYFNSFKRPPISFKSLMYYLVFVLFLLGLPYILGAVIEV